MGEERFMKRAIDLSREGVTGGHGGPFGTVIVKDGRIVGEAHNTVVSSKDPTAHAEVSAIRQAAKALDTFDLSGCEMYINGPPCAMCFGAIMWSRISRVYYVLSMKECDDIGLPHQHILDDCARPLEKRALPFVKMEGMDDEARAVYELWANMPGSTRF